MADDLLPDATTEGTVAFRGGQTWYRVTGDLAAAREHGVTPLVVLHGGPGCTHDYVLRIAALAAGGRPVVHYDQVGNGRSTHLPGRGADFWTVGLFLDELDAVLAHLGIADRYAVLGQSWGGMLAAEHAVRRPSGLAALVVADSPPSMRLWVEGCNRLRAGLPAEVQATLSQHEAAGSIDSPEYVAATRVFYDRHVCRVVPWPEEVARTFAALDVESTVYRTMNGPTEFHVTGTLADWSVLDRLDRVAVPTLVVSGRYDEATPETVRPFVDGVPGAVWELFEESSHMPHVEETQRFLDVVGRFLDTHL